MNHINCVLIWERLDGISRWCVPFGNVSIIYIQFLHTLSLLCSKFSKCINYRSVLPHFPSWSSSIINIINLILETNYSCQKEKKSSLLCSFFLFILWIERNFQIEWIAFHPFSVSTSYSYVSKTEWMNCSHLVR